MPNEKIQKKTMLYYARIHENTGLYEVCTLSVRSVFETYFAAIDKSDKHVYLFSYTDIGKLLFFDRDKALRKVLDAENAGLEIMEGYNDL